MQSKRSKSGWLEPEVVAGNGLLDRRAFLRGGAAAAGAMMGYTFVGSAAAEPLADDPWSKVPGGISPLQGGTPLVTFFVGVADVAATLEAAVAQGGRVIQPATSVPGVTFGLLADPQGQIVGLAQAGA